MAGVATPYKVELFGFPVSHSVSPQMHHAAAAALGLSLEYVPRALRPDQLAGAVQRLREPLYLGANVTLPHKPAMQLLVDYVTPRGARIGALNTVYKRNDSLVGDNTDAAAMMRCLTEMLSFAPGEERVVLLGAGGAARAAAVALLDAGVGTLALWNRSEERANELETLLRRLDPDGARRVLVLPEERLAEALGHASVVINATSAGLDGHSIPIDPVSIEPSTRVFDLVYGPASTPLVRAMRSRNIVAMDGLWMLVFQAAAAFTLWTEQDPPENVMFDAAVEALAARQSTATSESGLVVGS
jgi:shikimate dehydrogenase